MKEIIFGIISGTIAALGMGGGTVLILLLSLFSDLKQHLIQGTNLIVFIPTSIVAIYMNVKNKSIDYTLSKIFISFGIVGAILGSILSFKIESKTLKYRVIFEEARIKKLRKKIIDECSLIFYKEKFEPTAYTPPVSRRTVLQ